MQIIREAMELSEREGLFDLLRDEALCERLEELDKESVPRHCSNYEGNRKERRKQAAMARKCR